ncbi:response regulator [Phototrophicus methaneseepsis]|uniref:Response regulator n=1 Tax=Phototrophicus methaneseepsis TaxID=2710758 RepID=A0A7S8IEK5_9CHLR|nr:response regulator [Phototrophicus methaneseepsis]QPC82544.1 response regulator [Phototrophicus methaneseepsis]
MSGHILIVEDDAALCQLFERMLASQGYEVTLAYDGSQALATIQQKLPDLIILDMLLPYISGYDVIRAIRADEALKHILIIAATASTIAQNMPETAEADLLLMKPIGLFELRTMVARLLQQSPAQ